MPRHVSVYGDSIAYGVGAPEGYGFVPVLATLLAQRQRQRVPYLNFGVSGMTSIQLASAFYGLDAWLLGLHKAATVCILIGGDDIIADIPVLLTKNRQQIQAALVQSQLAYQSILRTVRNVTRCPIVVGTIYNPFPNTELAQYVINTFNAVVIESSASRYQIPVAPIHDAFSGHQAQLIDGYTNGVALSKSSRGESVPVHPNARGHRVVADVFAASLK